MLAILAWKWLTPVRGRRPGAGFRSIGTAPEPRILLRMNAGRRTLQVMGTPSSYIRPPAVAGTFYPQKPDALRAAVDGLLSETSSRKAPQPSAKKTMPKALIVPHAGYIYSGPIAASAYASLAAALDVAPIEIARIVLIGPAHRVYVPSIASVGAEIFQTPLGPAQVDLAWLSRARGVTVNPRAHEHEHCLEVQLPFLQRILPRTRIVPLLVSDAPADWVGGVLGELYGGPETLLVVSSDLSAKECHVRRNN